MSLERVGADSCCVIVTYNSAEILVECLQSLRGRPAVVIDNNSKDCSASIAEAAGSHVRVYRNRVNRGFAAAANQGLAAAGTADVVLVNPDVILNPTTLDTLAATATQLNAGAVGPRLLYPDGRVQPSARAFPALPHLVARRTAFGRTSVGKTLLNEYLKPSSGSGTRCVDWVIGAVMYLRRAALDVVGGFDERYFLYGEDVDLCTRLWQAGFPVLIGDQSSAVHVYRRASFKTFDVRRAETRHHWASIVKLARNYPGPFFLGRPVANATN